jgi:hypothetical protein
MPKKPNKPAKPTRKGTTQNRASNLSLAPLSMDEAVDAIFAIKPADVKRVVGSKPGKKGK